MRRHMLVAAVIFLLALLASSIAWAHRSHHGHHGRGFHHHGHRHHGHFHKRASVGIVIGAPLVWPRHYRTYPQRYYYSYPPAIVSSPPVVYIEQGNPQGAIQQAPVYWHYCSNPQGYYPYVRDCPSGWQQVPAQPPPSR